MLGLAEQRQTRQSEQEVPRPVTLIDKKKNNYVIYVDDEETHSRRGQTYMERYLDVVPKSLDHYCCNCRLNNYD